MFHWREVERQVRVAGVASRLPDAEAVRYWDTRPRGHRISAWASPQSSVVDEATLAARVAEIEARFAGVDPPLPPFWGGFLVRPDEVELWQGATDRLHDRIRYRRESGEWKKRGWHPDPGFSEARSGTGSGGARNVRRSPRLRSTARVRTAIRFRAIRVAPADHDSVEVLDDRVRIVAELYERDAEDGARPAAATHAVHGNADAAGDVIDDVGGRAFDHRPLGLGIGRSAPAEEILQPERVRGTRRRVVGERVVGEAHDVADPFGVSRLQSARPG